MKEWGWGFKILPGNIGKKNEIDIFSSYLATNTLTCGVGDVDSSQFQS